jgi:hypothetical protein
MKSTIQFWSYLAYFFLEWWMSQTQVVQKIKVHLLCSITFFFRKSCRCETMRKNTVDPGRPQMTIRHMRIASWVPKATKTHSECVMLIAFPLQQWLYECACMLTSTLPVLVHCKYLHGQHNMCPVNNRLSGPSRYWDLLLNTQCRFL